MVKFNLKDWLQNIGKNIVWRDLAKNINRKFLKKIIPFEIKLK